MKTINKVQTAAAGLAVLLALTACGGTAAGTQATDLPKTQNTRDISEGVQPDAAAVALLPESYKTKGEITVAMDLSSPPMTFLAPSFPASTAAATTSPPPPCPPPKNASKSWT